MNILKTVLATLLCTVTTVAPAVANPSVNQRQRTQFSETHRLLTKLGVTMNLNEIRCQLDGNSSRNVTGVYYPFSATMCVVDWKIIGKKEWYQTVYHEAFHAIQDGLDTKLADGNMISFFVNCRKVRSARACSKLYADIYHSASPHIQKHATNYSAKQTDSKQQWLEKEAVLFSDYPEMFPLFLRLLLKNVKQ